MKMLLDVKPADIEKKPSRDAVGRELFGSRLASSFNRGGR